MEFRCPDGYVRFKDIASELYRKDGLHDQWRTKKRVFAESFSQAVLEKSLRWIESQKTPRMKICALENNLVVGLGFWLCTGKIKAAGIDIKVGQLVNIPKFSWLCNAKNSAGNSMETYNDNLIENLILGHNMAISNFLGVFTVYEPLVDLRSLAVALEASNLPAESVTVPIQWEAAAAISVHAVSHLPIPASEPSSKSADTAMQWMQRYATALNSQGIKPKRDDTLSRCCKETGCRHKEALAAWNALPSGWKNHPRRSVYAGGLASARRPLGIR